MTRYDAYPDHPLCGIPQMVLDVARATLHEHAREIRMDPEDVEPIADAIVADLVRTGYINKPAAPPLDPTDVSSLPVPLHAALLSEPKGPGHWRQYKDPVALNALADINLIARMTPGSSWFRLTRAGEQVRAALLESIGKS